MRTATSPRSWQQQWPRSTRPTWPLPWCPMQLHARTCRLCMLTWPPAAFCSLRPSLPSLPCPLAAFCDSTLRCALLMCVWCMRVAFQLKCTFLDVSLKLSASCALCLECTVVLCWKLLWFCYSRHWGLVVDMCNHVLRSYCLQRGHSLKASRYIWIAAHLSACVLYSLTHKDERSTYKCQHQHVIYIAKVNM